MSLRDLADHVYWLPPGCQLWVSVGGPLAITPEQRALRAVEFDLRVLEWRMRKSKGSKPQPLPEPPYAHEREAKAALMDRKAAAYAERQRRRKPAPS